MRESLNRRTYNAVNAPACRIAKILVLGVGIAFGAFAKGPFPAGTERFWLENMIVHHGYSVDEAATGFGVERETIEKWVAEWRIEKSTLPDSQGLVKVLPWAPGRHPRIGFLDGAIDPQRDTKLSIFAPWEAGGYVVFDLPEAIWSNLGLTYLAHTHIDTIWTEQAVALAGVDWMRKSDGTLESKRVLPNQIAFGAVVHPRTDGIDFRYWLENGTEKTLTGLRNQLCLMLKNASGFNAQTAENKLALGQAAAVRNGDGDRWIVTACERSRTWENPPVPCIHADPEFPDCAPAERVEVRGRVFFYAGSDIREEVERRRNAGTLFASED